MTKRWFKGLLTAAVLVASGLSFSAAPPAEAAKKTEVMISAAASLQDALDQIAAQYERQHPEVDLVFNYAASGTLQKQIEQGAPADLFFSAGDKQMKALADGGFISAQTGLLKNQLVVIVPSNARQNMNTITELAGSAYKRVAVGQPESVPAGQYARQSLEAKGIWNTLQSKLVFAKDVRQVLSYVETGNADAGFVYKTDALTSKKVRIVSTVGGHVHSPIHYPLGIVKGTKNEAAAKAVYSYLQTKTAADIFKSHGFSVQ